MISSGRKGLTQGACGLNDDTIGGAERNLADSTRLISGHYIYSLTMKKHKGKARQNYGKWGFMSTASGDTKHYQKIKKIKIFLVIFCFALLTESTLFIQIL